MREGSFEIFVGPRWGQGTPVWSFVGAFNCDETRPGCFRGRHSLYGGGPRGVRSQNCEALGLTFGAMGNNSLISDAADGRLGHKSKP